ncbi:MAG: response regulator transcription factor [Ruminococcaceae bacterium]|nr:response regulator transcription factor [Oscillospiraceae bacterium]
MSYRILVVDDEKKVITMLQNFLQREGYQVSCALDGTAAIQKSRQQPDLILLDINMPQMDGIEVCKSIREFVSCPIIFLTARDSDEDKVESFSAGGDDYIVKPFSLTELGARIKAHLRRERRNKDIQRKIFGDITIDYSSREIFVRGEALFFNKKDFDIIQLLSLNRGQVFERAKIYDRVWGIDGEGDDTVIMEHIRRIRLTFAKAGIESCIETIWGVGYKWVG